MKQLILQKAAELAKYSLYEHEEAANGKRQASEGDPKKRADGNKSWSKETVLFNGLITFILRNKDHHLRTWLWHFWETPLIYIAEMHTNTNIYSHNPILTELKFIIHVQIPKKFWSKMARQEYKAAASQLWWTLKLSFNAKIFIWFNAKGP